MVAFPADRVYRRKKHGFWRSLFIAVILAIMIAAAWFYGEWTDQRQPVPVAGQKLYVVDGDSFVIGTRKLRLDGIDAPEIKQTCTDSQNVEWPCGRAARASLEKLLLEPGLSCDAEVQDRYARSLATCRSATNPDIAAVQVKDGMAVTHEFNGMRDYGREEDAARNQKRGIWRGAFERPEDWRAKHPRDKALNASATDL
jgi:endonuclease YncB( thermonuclease family)